MKMGGGVGFVLPAGVVDVAHCGAGVGEKISWRFLEGFFGGKLRVGLGLG